VPIVRLSTKVIAAACVLALFLFLWQQAKPAVVAVAYDVFDQVRDVRSQLLRSEPWEDIKPLSSTQNWSVDWRNMIDPSKGVGHALGGRFQPDENSVFAYDASVKAGFRLLEVDLWLSPAGSLYCAHDIPSQFEPSHSFELFENLLARAQADNVFLIIDFKQDASIVVPAVLSIARKLGAERNTVFQIYHDKDLSYLVQEAQKQGGFGLPIVTTYKSHHSPRYLADQVKRIGLGGLVVHESRLNQIVDRIDNLTVFTHPVLSCLDFLRSPKGTIPFVNRNLNCPLEN